MAKRGRPPQVPGKLIGAGVVPATGDIFVMVSVEFNDAQLMMAHAMSKQMPEVKLALPGSIVFAGQEDAEPAESDEKTPAEDAPATATPGQGNDQVVIDPTDAPEPVVASETASEAVPAEEALPVETVAPEEQPAVVDPNTDAGVTAVENIDAEAAAEESGLQIGVVEEEPDEVEEAAAEAEEEDVEDGW